MRLSTIFELLLIALLVAFAAYGRVVRSSPIIFQAQRNALHLEKHHIFNASFPPLKQATEEVNKHCQCSSNICNCCREFVIPLVQLRGPSCATIRYLEGDKLQVQLTHGGSIVANSVVEGKRPKPVCMAMPGQFSKFCGKVYSVKREAGHHFKACLGLELLTAQDEIEASLRISCFRFGPDGLKIRPAEPVPIGNDKKRPLIDGDDNDDDDNDGDDIFGIDEGEGYDEGDDDEEKLEDENSLVESDNGEDEDDDILGLGALIETLFDRPNSKKQKISISTISPILPLSDSSNSNDVVVIKPVKITSAEMDGFESDFDHGKDTEESTFVLELVENTATTSPIKNSHSSSDDVNGSASVRPLKRHIIKVKNTHHAIIIRKKLHAPGSLNLQSTLVSNVQRPYEPIFVSVTKQSTSKPPLKGNTNINGNEELPESSETLDISDGETADETIDDNASTHHEGDNIGSGGIGKISDNTQGQKEYVNDQQEMKKITFTQW